MKKTKFLFLIAFLPLLFQIRCHSSSNSKKTDIQNLNSSKQLSNMPIRDYEPEMIGEGIISTAAFEGHATLTPEGNTLYYAIYSNDHGYCTIAFSQNINGQWQPPQIAEFSGRYSDGSPSLTPDGSKLFFSSKRPIDGEQQKEEFDIWYVEKDSNGWSEPLHMDSPINTEYNEFSPVLSSDGTLYFCSNRPGGYGLGDVYCSKRSENIYQSPQNLGDSINSQYEEGNVGVSPDGKILFVMVQNKPGDYGADDIYYSRKIEGKWSKSKNIGEIINTYTYDFSPKVNPDGKYLYFSSRINTRFFRKMDEQTFTYESFKKMLNGPLNGFGNIYRIKMEKLNLN